MEPLDRWIGEMMDDTRLEQRHGHHRSSTNNGCADNRPPQIQVRFLPPLQIPPQLSRFIHVQHCDSECITPVPFGERNMVVCAHLFRGGSQALSALAVSWFWLAWNDVDRFVVRWSQSYVVKPGISVLLD